MSGETRYYLYKGYRLRVEVGVGGPPDVLGFVDGPDVPGVAWPTVRGPDVDTVYGSLVDMIEAHYRATTPARTAADAG